MRQDEQGEKDDAGAEPMDDQAPDLALASAAREWHTDLARETRLGGRDPDRAAPGEGKAIGHDQACRFLAASPAASILAARLASAWRRPATSSASSTQMPGRGRMRPLLQSSTESRLTFRAAAMSAL